MNDEITVDDCRKLLTHTREDFYSYQEERVFYGRVHRVIMESFSLEERFNLAKLFHKELESYSEFRFMDEKKAESIHALFDSIRVYEEITHDDFTFLLNEMKTAFLRMLVMNKAFPIEVLLDGSFLQRHVDDPNYLNLKYAVELAMENRKVDIILYYRNMVSGSENMTDEMVLSVAGVKL